MEHLWIVTQSNYTPFSLKTSSIWTDKIIVHQHTVKFSPSIALIHTPHIVARLENFIVGLGFNNKIQVRFHSCPVVA